MRASLQHQQAQHLIGFILVYFSKFVFLNGRNVLDWAEPAILKSNTKFERSD